MAASNRTLTLDDAEREQFKSRLKHVSTMEFNQGLENCTIHGELINALPYIPENSVDLLFLDPPYNLRKKFISDSFAKTSVEEYTDYLESWLVPMIPLLKKTSSIYICGDYHSSTSIHILAEKYFKVRNRITWQREKGRGAKFNWKNSSEDIWFCTMSDDYKFYVDRVKEKKKVVAPYRDNGMPKDWDETIDGNFRLTYPSNIWTDLTVPFWSMPENTQHPTQKPEKLLAKIILASTDVNDLVLDPFLGSGTTSVVSCKLGRKYIGIEKEEEYCLYAEKRLELAKLDNTIQGYTNGVFWERNTLSEQMKLKFD